MAASLGRSSSALLGPSRAPRATSTSRRTSRTRSPLDRSEARTRRECDRGLPGGATIATSLRPPHRPLPVLSRTDQESGAPVQIEGPPVAFPSINCGAPVIGVMPMTRSQDSGKGDAPRLWSTDGTARAVTKRGEERIRTTSRGSRPRLPLDVSAPRGYWPRAVFSALMLELSWSMFVWIPSCFAVASLASWSASSDSCWSRVSVLTNSVQSPVSG